MTLPASYVFLFAAAIFATAGAALAYLRYRGGCREALVGAWACGAGFWASVVISGSVAWHEAQPASLPRSWAEQQIEYCLRTAQADCDDLATALREPAK